MISAKGFKYLKISNTVFVFASSNLSKRLGILIEEFPGCDVMVAPPTMYEAVLRLKKYFENMTIEIEG